VKRINTAKEKVNSKAFTRLKSIKEQLFLKKKKK